MKNEQTTLEVVKDQPINEELIKKKEIKDTPFLVVTTNGKSFGTFGRYKITEDKETEEEIINELSTITWNRVIQIMTLVHEILTKKE